MRRLFPTDSDAIAETSTFYLFSPVFFTVVSPGQDCPSLKGLGPSRTPDFSVLDSVRAPGSNFLVPPTAGAVRPRGSCDHDVAANTDRLSL